MKADIEESDIKISDYRARLNMLIAAADSAFDLTSRACHKLKAEAFRDALTLLDIVEQADTPKDKEKPPLGLIPKLDFETNKAYTRLIQIIDAMRRYSVHEKRLPNIWKSELRERVDTLMELLER